MAETRRYSLDAQLDITQILSEAQHRWLRPTEICEILQNYKKFRIAAESPDRPPSGSLFLFDRKVLRYFRKDGHNWRKKKDGKTVKEAHERLKAGSVDVLHCYYAHGEDNDNFQRRSYWMLEEELSHIVLVHYREVKGNRANLNRSRESNSVPSTEEDVANCEGVSSSGSKFQQYDHQGVSQVTDTTSFNSTQASEHEDAESAYRNQASPGIQSNLDSRSSEMLIGVGSVPYYSNLLSSNNYQGKFSAAHVMNAGLLSQGEINKNPIDNGLASELHQDHEFPGWENIAESGKAGGYPSADFWMSLPSTQASAVSMVHGHNNDVLDQDVTAIVLKNQGFERQTDAFEEWQAAYPDASHLTKWIKNQKSDSDLNLVQNAYYTSSPQPLLHDLTTRLNDVHREEFGDSLGFSNTYATEPSLHHVQVDFQLPHLIAEGSPLQLGSEGNQTVEDKKNHPAIRQPLLEVMRGGLKKLDSFDRWVSKELGDVKEPTMQPGSAMYWETVGNEVGDDSNISNQTPLDNYMLGPSLSQDQLFSIIDFSPNCSFSGSEIKVLIMGQFLRSREEVSKHKWACMFGEIEVPAEIISDGVLRCHTPMHETGRVPFYVTCSNRLACSEVREFEFLPSPVGDIPYADPGNSNSDETLLHMRFGKLLSLGSSTQLTTVQSSTAENSQLCNKISILLNDDPEWEQMLNSTRQDEYSADNVKDQLLQKLLKEKLHHWLLRKIAEDGKGASVLDEGGQGVLHFAAALGYHWAIPPTIAAGVSVNFRDVNGWTALHWAAFYGRECTVAFLISLGAATGIVTDPTPEYPSGRTPADLASSKGHKGIAGYLAESALSSHLTSLELKESKDSDNRIKAIGTVPELVATPFGDGSFGDGYIHHGSLKDPLAAVRNATQAAARIHQVYRVQSFQRKQIKEYGDTEYGISDERALSLLALKAMKSGKNAEPVHSAAVRIQNKFRSWKGRRDYLLIRQRIIKIQAHVRGHQVRKNYRKIVWTVGILDKVILRWRRKGRGLSGFKREALTASTSATGKETEDEYDHLKDGRKQSEERLKKAVARVQSMARYPEARAQYHRLMNVVSEMQDTKTAYEKILSDQDADFDDDLIDLDALLEDDSFMDMAI